MTTGHHDPASRPRREAEVDFWPRGSAGASSAETIERDITESVVGLSGARIQIRLPVVVSRVAGSGPERSVDVRERS